MERFKGVFKKIKRVRFSVIIRDALNCFICACGIMLYALFLEENPSAHAKADIQEAVVNLFYICFVLLAHSAL